jgi:hypothetical protein
MAIWCHDPGCCDPDLATFLGGLLAEERETGLPTFGARFLEDWGEYAPAMPVRVWRAGSIDPVYTGPVGESPAVVMQHACTAGDKDLAMTGRAMTVPGRMLLASNVTWPT